MANIFFDIGQKNNNTRNDREKLLFIEGTDDAYFLDRILANVNADPDYVGLVTVGGTGQFLSNIKSFSKSSQFTTGKNKGLVIVRDVDEDFNGVSNEMAQLFFSLFGVVVRHGEIVVLDGRAYGFFLMPGQDRAGDLERLCLDTVEGKVLALKSYEFLNSVEPVPSDQVFKRLAQVYLAGHVGALCRGAGRGFNRGQFDDTHAILNPLKEFLSDFIRAGLTVPSVVEPA